MRKVRAPLRTGNILVAEKMITVLSVIWIGLTVGERVRNGAGEMGEKGYCGLNGLLRRLLRIQKLAGEGFG